MAKYMAFKIDEQRPLLDKLRNSIIKLYESINKSKVWIKLLKRLLLSSTIEIDQISTKYLNQD